MKRIRSNRFCIGLCLASGVSTLTAQISAEFYGGRRWRHAESETAECIRTQHSLVGCQVAVPFGGAGRNAERAFAQLSASELNSTASFSLGGSFPLTEIQQGLRWHMFADLQWTGGAHYLGLSLGATVHIGEHFVLSANGYGAGTALSVDTPLRGSALARQLDLHGQLQFPSMPWLGFHGSCSYAFSGADEISSPLSEDKPGFSELLGVELRVNACVSIVYRAVLSREITTQRLLLKLRFKDLFESRKALKSADRSCTPQALTRSPFVTRRTSGILLVTEKWRGIRKDQSSASGDLESVIWPAAKLSERSVDELTSTPPGPPMAGKRGGRDRVSYSWPPPPSELNTLSAPPIDPEAARYSERIPSFPDAQSFGHWQEASGSSDSSAAERPPSGLEPPSPSEAVPFDLKLLYGCGIPMMRSVSAELIPTLPGVPPCLLSVGELDGESIKPVEVTSADRSIPLVLSVPGYKRAAHTQLLLELEGCTMTNPDGSFCDLAFTIPEAGMTREFRFSAQTYGSKPIIRIYYAPLFADGREPCLAEVASEWPISNSLSIRCAGLAPSAPTSSSCSAFPGVPIAPARARANRAELSRKIEGWKAIALFREREVSSSPISLELYRAEEEAQERATTAYVPVTSFLTEVLENPELIEAILPVVRETEDRCGDRAIYNLVSTALFAHIRMLVTACCEGRALPSTVLNQLERMACLSYLQSYVSEHDHGRESVETFLSAVVSLTGGSRPRRSDPQGALLPIRISDMHHLGCARPQVGEAGIAALAGLRDNNNWAKLVPSLFHVMPDALQELYQSLPFVRDAHQRFVERRASVADQLETLSGASLLSEGAYAKRYDQLIDRHFCIWHLTHMLTRKHGGVVSYSLHEPAEH